MTHPHARLNQFAGPETPMKNFKRASAAIRHSSAFRSCARVGVDEKMQ
jgi:hypothetical protein